MTRRPILTSSWDPGRKQTSYKIAIEGTGKFLLFTDETLRQLLEQITEAMKATRVSTSTG